METIKKYCRKCKKVFNPKKFMATIICEDCDPFMKEHPYNLYQKGLAYDKLKKQRDELLDCLKQLKEGHYERVKSYVGQQLPHWAIKWIELTLNNNEND